MANLWTEISTVPDRPNVKDVIKPKHGQESETTKEQFLGRCQDLLRLHLFNRLCHSFFASVCWVLWWALLRWLSFCSLWVAGDVYRVGAEGERD